MPERKHGDIGELVALDDVINALADDPQRSGDRTPFL
jgi:hypothetical protein